MADDERRSETFIREVDEELRRDQLKAVWDRFAPLIIGVCVLVVVVTAGYRGWLWWHERQTAQAGDRFLAALEEIASGKRTEGETKLQAIAAEGGGYGAIAKLRLAGEKAVAGAKAEALAAFDALAGDASVSGPLRDLARVRAALIALDMGDLAGAKARAEPLNVAGNPWRHAAREVLGTAAYQAGDLETARSIFSEIQEDAQTPPDLWIRSGLMISLIEGQAADSAPAFDSGGPDAAAPAAATDGSTGDGVSSAPEAPGASEPNQNP